ncbi:MAG: Spy/CpxP family protein refolding chaperone [Phormidesmis sp. CAN_BIN44]|nr:Spy/CpxP family protein refolding chaperone [Phormidesmis sp. CAN_BIN44]
MNTRWIALLASGMLISMPTIATVAQAESTSLTQLFPALVGVSLTPTQQAQIQDLTQQTLPQVQSMLTTEQQTQFTAALAQGKGVRVAASSLNLSIAQRLQILNVLQTSRSQIDTILTPKQQQQVQQNVQALQQQGR